MPNRLDRARVKVIAMTLVRSTDRGLLNVLRLDERPVAWAYYLPWLEDAFMSEDPPRTTTECIDRFIADWRKGYAG